MVKYIHRRNYKFKELIAKSNKKRILGVGIDPSKHFHEVLIFDFTGKIIIKPFEMDVLKKGYKLIKSNIAKAKKKISAQAIYIAIEGVTYYSENLIRHLAEDYKNICIVTCNAVAANRKQKSLGGLKTDVIDAGSIGDLLIRGEFNELALDSNLYYKLRKCTYWREKKLSMLMTLKNQIQTRMDKIYPGLNESYDEYKPIYSSPRESTLYQGLLNLQKLPKEIMEMKDSELRVRLGYGKQSSGPRKVESLRKRLMQMLLPDEEISRIELDILKKDVRILRFLENEIKECDDEIIRLAKKTPAKYISNQIKGVNDFFAATYISAIGDIRKYKDASKILSKSGLCPKTNESGSSKTRHPGIKKAGSKILRSILYKMASTTIMSEKTFMDYNERLKRERNIHWKKRRVAVANKLNRVLFALMRDKKPYKRF